MAVVHPPPKAMHPSAPSTAHGSVIPIPAFWYRWLQVVTVGTIAFGPAVQPCLVLAHAVMGSVMVGWGLARWLTLGGPFRHGERHAELLRIVPRARWSR